MNTDNTQSSAIAVKGIDMTVLLTGDPERSIAFYRDTLGLLPTTLDPQGRGAEFTLADGSTFGIWRPDQGAKQGVNVMFSVDDVEAAVAAYRMRGAHLTHPTETPVCFMSYGADPDGNAITIHQRKADTSSQA